VLALTFDVRSPEAIEAAVHEAEAFAGGLDGLVNNAGVLSEASVLDLDAPSWDEVFAVNCRAPFLLARAVLPGMLAAGSGSIVNICSIESFVARPNHAAYGASKAALLNFTRAAAVEYGRQGVRSNAICPGSIAGGLFDEHVALFPDPAAVTAELVGRNYAGRLGRPDEVASAAVYLLGDESGFVNGSSIVIDGGRTAGT